MKNKNKNRKILLTFGLAAGILFALCACGKKQESTADPGTGTQPETAKEATASAPYAEASSAAIPTESRTAADASEEDPWAEGYYFDEALTAALWQRFTVENTNETGGSGKPPVMTRDFLEELDRRAGLWLYDGISDEETERAMLALSFRFPDDVPGTERGLKSVKAGVYSLGGRDPDGLAARIRLGNTEACFYLFLRAYYSPEEDRSRVYMINGLVW